MDIYDNCEVVSLDTIKNVTYNMDFAEAIDFSELWDEPTNMDEIFDHDEWGRKRVANRF
jgi:hypothetical protein